jgi:predicted Zn-dependent protease
LTQEDIYIREETWRYAFAYRRAPGYALVSTARMDEALYGNPSNEELLKARLNKMVAKTIGQIHYHLPLSEDPRSAMYGRVLGPQDLDRMTDAFDPVPANARE